MQMGLHMLLVQLHTYCCLWCVSMCHCGNQLSNDVRPWVAGKKLDQKVEQTIQASGVLLLTLVAVVLVVRDTINLGSGKPFM